MAEARRVWIETRQPDMANILERLVFIDETSLKTNLVKTTGWAPVGARLIDHAPFGHWNTQTFIADLAHDGLIAPWVLDGAMNGASFDAYVEHQLAPALKPGQIVIADNLSSHKSPRAQALLRAQGNDLIFLPPYSPDRSARLRGPTGATVTPHPIEIIRAFTRTDGVHALILSKLKTLNRKTAARTCQALWTCAGAVCDLFPSQECTNYFKAVGYGLD